MGATARGKPLRPERRQCAAPQPCERAARIRRPDRREEAIPRNCLNGKKRQPDKAGVRRRPLVKKKPLRIIQKWAAPSIIGMA